jgi:phosphatidylinositol alpha-1,6-mannosyltransferase
MKVLYLTPGVFDKGGISRYNRYQINALRDLLGPAQVTVLSLLGPDGSQSSLETPFEVDWHGDRASASLGSEVLYSAQALRQSLSQHPDVIWAAHLHFSTLTRALAALTGAADVVQVYGHEIWTPRRHRPDTHWGLKHCEHVVSDCYFSADYVREHYRPGDRIHVLWDCVDTDRFTPGPPAVAVLAKYGIPDPAQMVNILTLGRISQCSVYKGYQRLLEVFASLPEQTELIYGGGGDLVPSLRSQAQSLGVADRVVFTGFIDEADLPDIYRSASIFCLIGDRGPGRGEGIPLTPLEAASCGVPILVGNQDGSREAVEEGVNGFALNPFDLNLIRRCLLQLITNADYRRELGNAGRKRIEREHDYAVFRDRTWRFLQELN